jgi:hypothetical protein
MPGGLRGVWCCILAYKDFVAVAPLSVSFADISPSRGEIDVGAGLTLPAP